MSDVVGCLACCALPCVPRGLCGRLLCLVGAAAVLVFGLSLGFGGADRLGVDGGETTLAGVNAYSQYAASTVPPPPPPPVGASASSVATFSVVAAGSLTTWTATGRRLYESSGSTQSAAETFEAGVAAVAGVPIEDIYFTILPASVLLSVRVPLARSSYPPARAYARLDCVLSGGPCVGPDADLCPAEAAAAAADCASHAFGVTIERVDTPLGLVAFPPPPPGMRPPPPSPPPSPEPPLPPGKPPPPLPSTVTRRRRRRAVAAAAANRPPRWFTLVPSRTDRRVLKWGCGSSQKLGAAPWLRRWGCPLKLTTAPCITKNDVYTGTMATAS